MWVTGRILQVLGTILGKGVRVLEGCKFEGVGWEEERSLSVLHGWRIEIQVVVV